MPTYRVMIAEFPYSDRTHPDASDWVAQTICEMRDDKRIGPGNIGRWRLSDTPIPMCRNRCLIQAEEANFDFVLMIDNDVGPDYLVGQDPTAKPFWRTAFDHAINSPEPCIVAAPYVGPPPEENVYVFKFHNKQSNHPNPDFQIGGVSRLEASTLTGFQRAQALATGLILMDMRAIKKMKHPRFYYEYNATSSAKLSTEDITFSRDAHYYGIPLWCAWDSWCLHYKLKGCGKPQNIPDGCVPDMLMERARQLVRAELATGVPTAEPIKVTDKAGPVEMDYLRTSVTDGQQFPPAVTVAKP